MTFKGENLRAGSIHVHLAQLLFMPGLLATLGLNASPFKTKLLEAQADARHAGAQIKEAFGDAIGEKLGQFGAAIAFEELGRRAVEFGERIYNVALRLGISTEAAQRWDYALRQSGSSLEAATGAFLRS